MIKINTGTIVSCMFIIKMENAKINSKKGTLVPGSFNSSASNALTSALSKVEDSYSAISNGFNNLYTYLKNYSSDAEGIEDIHTDIGGEILDHNVASSVVQNRKKLLDFNFIEAESFNGDKLLVFQNLLFKPTYNLNNLKNNDSQIPDKSKNNYSQIPNEVKKYLEWAKNAVSRHLYYNWGSGHGMTKEWDNTYNYGYDCSGFVDACLRQANIFNDMEGYSTRNLPDALENHGFACIFEQAPEDFSLLLPGDIILKLPSEDIGHVEIYYGDGMTVGARNGIGYIDENEKGHTGIDENGKPTNYGVSFANYSTVIQTRSGFKNFKVYRLISNTDNGIN